MSNTRIAKTTIYIFVLLFYSYTGTAFAEKSDVTNIEGYYSSPSTRCTEVNKASGELNSCKSRFRDCASVKKNINGTYALQVYSTQANQHVCAVDGEAKLNGAALVHEFEDSPGHRLIIRKDRKTIRLSQVAPEKQASANCGAHATFDGLVLLKVSDNPGLHICFEDR